MNRLEPYHATTCTSEDNRLNFELNPLRHTTLPLSTHSAVEMNDDSALYKFMIDVDIDTQPLQTIVVLQTIA